MFMQMKNMSNRVLPLLLIVLMAVGCGKKKQGPYEPAKMVYEETDIDLGDIFIEDGVKTLEFVVRNGGDMPLSINDVVSSCDCTTTHFDRTTQLYRDDKTTIRVEFNPKDVTVGPFERMVGVYSSLKRRPDTLYFHGVAKHK